MPIAETQAIELTNDSANDLNHFLSALTTQVPIGDAATVSILLKTGFLYAIMATGAIWEKVVFGQYLFAPAFFWEDVFSFAVIALHTAYVWALLTHVLSPVEEMWLALAAYAAYVINAGQFLWNLRVARLQAATTPLTDEAAA